jgi:acetylornithine deacetylase
MFNGHTDVAPLTKKQYASWSIGSPWRAEIIDGKIYGRGASDMKGGITSFLWAIKILKDLGVKIKGDIIAAINIGEESQNTKIGSRSIVKRGYIPDLLINAEPTNLEIYPATIGWFFFKVTVFGKASHVAYNRQSIYPTPYSSKVLGVNAIEKMDTVIDFIKRLNYQWGINRKHPLSQPGNMNLCIVSINGGEYFSSIPDSCEAIYAVSFNPDLKSREVIREIKDTVKNAASSDYWLKEGHIKLEIPYLKIDKNVVEPIDIPKTYEGCIALLKAYREIMRAEPNFGCFPAVCDANTFHSFGIPSIIFGPGDLSMGTHAENEYIPVDQVINATKIYANFIIKWWD